MCISYATPFLSELFHNNSTYMSHCHTYSSHAGCFSGYWIVNWQNRLIGHKILSSWKKLKRSGHYHRTIKKEQENFVKRANEIQNELIANRTAFVCVIPAANTTTAPRISSQPTTFLPASENLLYSYISASSGMCMSYVSYSYEHMCSIMLTFTNIWCMFLADRYHWPQWYRTHRTPQFLFRQRWWYRKFCWSSTRWIYQERKFSSKF